MVLWMQLGHFYEMQREAMGMYTGVIPYLSGVVRHLKRRWGFQRLRVVGNPDGPNRLRIGGIAVTISRKWRNVLLRQRKIKM